MDNMAFDKKGTIKYLVWTFGMAWILQIIVAVLYKNNLAGVGQLLMAIMMFTPLFGVLRSGHKLSGMGWKPKLKGKIKVLLVAWLLPSFLVATGALMYFLIFPGHFDMSGQYMVENAGSEVLKQLEAQGLTYPVYILITVVGCLTYIPFFNMFLALGEEVGWRGFLYPMLKAKFGKRKGWLIGGVIWGIWHWPVIWLIGYEYGTDYVGFPVVGMLVFCIFATVSGILCDWLYEKSQCIWIPSIFHGAINAAGTIPLALCTTGTGSAILLGPTPMGVLAGIPFIIFAVMLFLKAGKGEEQQDTPEQMREF